MIKIVTVIIEKEIEVMVDESKFDETFLREFRESFYPLHTVWEHIHHLAQLKARGLIDNWSPHEDGVFIEGYGRVKTMGIKLRELTEDYHVME